MKPYALPDSEDFSNPVVLDKPYESCRIDHYVGAKAPNLETSFRIACPQAIERCGAHNMDHGVIEK